MSEARSESPVGALVGIGAAVAVVAAAFAYVAGWLTPERLTPAKIVDSLAPASGAAPGYRRNHAKGVCFTGQFEANGNGARLTTAATLASGVYPVSGRFNLATPDPKAQDGLQRVRGLGLRIVTPDRREWRMAMIDAPFFPVSTPQAFYELQTALARKGDPDAMKNFIAAHPEFLEFVGWAKTAPFTGSYAEERYNSLDSFVFDDAAGADHVVRWSFLPVAPPVAVAANEIAGRDPDFLEGEIAQRVQQQPARWKMVVTEALRGDPTADPSKPWPEGRSAVEVGTLSVMAIEAEADGPCRDLNFDPTVLPPGVHVSDDPFPAARSAAYSVSFNRRSAEDKDYPHAVFGAKP